MRLRTVILVAATALSLLTGCKKSTDVIDMSGYTERDAVGNIPPGGMVDAHDWGLDSQLPATVIENMSHFNKNVDHSDSCSVPSANIKAYPNPCTGNFIRLEYSIRCAEAFTLIYSIVDINLHPLETASVLSVAGSNTTDVAISALPVGMYRIYYQFYDRSGSIVYQGHGDIKRS